MDYELVTNKHVDMFSLSAPGYSEAQLYQWNMMFVKNTANHIHHNLYSIIMACVFFLPFLIHDLCVCVRNGHISAANGIIAKKCTWCQQWDRCCTWCQQWDGYYIWWQQWHGPFLHMMSTVGRTFTAHGIRSGTYPYCKGVRSVTVATYADSSGTVAKRWC